MEDSRSNETGSTLNWKYSKTPGQVSLEPDVFDVIENIYGFDGAFLFLLRSHKRFIALTR